MSTVGAWLIALGIVVAITSLLLLDVAKDLLRTLKRIEARMTLLNPIEEERKVLEGTGILSLSTRCDIRDRAIHPDIWWQQYYDKIKDLSGDQLKEARALQRHRERKHRD